MNTPKVSLTQNEKMVLVCIARNLMNSANGGLPKDRDETLCYTDQILSDGPRYVDEISPRSLPGIMSSLAKKGMVYTQGNYTSLSPEGFETYINTVEPWYQELKTSREQKAADSRKELFGQKETTSPTAVDAAKVEEDALCAKVIDVLDYIVFRKANTHHTALINGAAKLAAAAAAGKNILSSLEWDTEPMIDGAIYLHQYDLAGEALCTAVAQYKTGKLEGASPLRARLYLLLEMLDNEWKRALHNAARGGRSTSAVANLIDHRKAHILADIVPLWSDHEGIVAELRNALGL